MILYDFSQIVKSAVLDNWSKEKKKIELPLLRHIALSQILRFREKVSNQNDDIVLCFDSRDYWRKDIFPLYKKNRSKMYATSTFDWDEFFIVFNALKKEFKENLPYKCIEVHKAEADDIISVLSLNSDKDVIIVSSDKDFIQLQLRSEKIRQFSPLHKKFITLDHNDYDFFDHIVRGDSGDGIPNILSDDDTFVTDGKRMKQLRSTKVETWRVFGLDRPEMFCENAEMLRKFKRNYQLIDLRQIPEELKNEILNAFNSYEMPAGNIFNYLVKHKLRNILARGNF